MATTADTEIRELDSRRNDGIEVTLLWNSRTDELLVVVEDEREGDSFELAVEPAKALEVFRHPYAYAASGAPSVRRSPCQ